MFYLHLIWLTGPPYRSHWGPPVPGMVEVLTPSCALPRHFLVAIYLIASAIYPSRVSYPNAERLIQTSASLMNPTIPFYAFW